MKRILIPILITALLSLAFGSGYASQDNAALGSAFAYQGQLLDGETPVDGACDFVFGLWSAAAGGLQIGSGQAVDNAPVTNGLFAVTLNAGGEFTASAFDGSPRWLEIAARCPAGSGAYTTLAPRQALQPSPYALYSSTSPWSGLSNIPEGFADEVDNDTLFSAGSGLALNGTQFSVTGAPWGGLTGVPAGFADGVDNDTQYTAGSGLALNGTEFSALGTAYQQVLVVAQSGGDFESIQAALDSITDASAEHAYLVWVAPGVYTETVTLKPYVEIEGAGQELVRITFHGSLNDDTGTVIGADHAAIRHVTIQNTGGTPYGYAIAAYNLSTNPQVEHVTLLSSGGGSFNYGLYNASASPVVRDAEVIVSGPGAYGISNYNGSPSLENVQVTVSSSASVSYGIHNNLASPTLTDVSITLDGPDGRGLYNQLSSPVITNLSLVQTGSGNSYGIYSLQSTYTIQGCQVNISGEFVKGAFTTSASTVTLVECDIQASGSGLGYAVSNQGSPCGTTHVRNSRLQGSTLSVVTSGSCYVYLALTQAIGAVNPTGVVCFDVYNANYSPITCTVTK